MAARQANNAIGGRNHDVTNRREGSHGPTPNEKEPASFDMASAAIRAQVPPLERRDKEVKVGLGCRGSSR